MRQRTRILLQWSRQWEQDLEFYISSPANETRTGPYLVPVMILGRESSRALVGTFTITSFVVGSGHFYHHWIPYFDRILQNLDREQWAGRALLSSNIEKFNHLRYIA